MWLIVLLKLLQADDDASNNDQVHSDVPTVTVPSSDDHTSDSANQDPNDPAVRIHTHNIILISS